MQPSHLTLLRLWQRVQVDFNIGSCIHEAKGIGIVSKVTNRIEADAYAWHLEQVAGHPLLSLEGFNP